MLAVHGRIVSEHDNVTACGLYFQQRLLKPSKLATRVVALAPHMEVEHITAVSVDGDDFRVSWEGLSVLESQILRVVAILAILVSSFVTKPLPPELLDMVDSVVGVGFAEVLFVDGPGIMIAMNRIDGDISTFDGILDNICHLFCVSGYFCLRVSPDVVW